ncbi:chondroitinase-B domain-containing protein [Flavobacterium sp. NG2]|uniref:chondroitinase-B domain-containing protein n=1 Tax=Flavobacterium sp. NG2 TaxID=3097547 RepID=UPI002A82746A|nr:chondroitinase-B domain-containing protein [Flavobacterium sp. NG2]WPR72470.1 chondroitinase-B domain-containing protein [Flavobacterium sp. NG2]
MKIKKLLLLRLFILVITLSVNAQQETVTNKTDLLSAVNRINAGTVTTIIIADGTYTDAFINIKRTGTAANPIVVKAANPGQVFFEGNSRVAMGSAYITFQGVVFRNPNSLVTSGTTIEPVVKFRYDSSNLCNYCTLTNVKIDGYNGTAAQSDKLPADGGTGLTFKWVLLYGQYNEISYCTFVNKKGIGSVINDNRDASTANYSKIHHNYFSDRRIVGDYVDDHNDQDAIRIGNSSTSLSDSFTEVYDNLFNNWQGEIEIISNKSGNNKYYNNTFRNYSGSLTLRHGDNCEVYGNYFFANNNNFSGGIRVIGENHKIYNNYIEGVNSTKLSASGSSTSSNLGGINIMKGQASSPLNGYYQVKNATILNNTFVNCDFGIRVGGGSQTLPPLDLLVANNIFLMNGSTKIAINELIAANSSYPYTYTGNIRQSGTWTLNGILSNNQFVTSGLLTSDTDFYRIKSGSAAINAGVGTYSFLTKDILDGIRPTAFDAGAEEFGAGGTRLPYTVADVGVKVGFGGSGSLGLSKNKLRDQNLRIFPVPVSGDYLNIYLENQILGKIQVVNIQGKVVLEYFCFDSAYKLDVSTLSKGTYVLKVQGVSKHFVK